MKKIANYLSGISLISFFAGLVAMRLGNGVKESVLILIIFAVSSVCGVLSLFYLTDKRLRLLTIIVTLIAIFFAVGSYAAIAFENGSLRFN